ncbi:MAG: molybdopterin-binding protein, partial [Erysipelotrichaceae bacterium]|nr:molybdopterin-binding protein [Erysipelotrichaceae bacterium]
MKCIKTVDAVGHMLCHDITQIVPGEFKGPAFKKGHIIQEEDIPVLLRIGKENLYVWQVDETMMHEDQAAEVLADLCTRQDPFFSYSAVKEGKIETIAQTDGLLKIDRARLVAVNTDPQMMIACRHHNTPVKKGDVIAGTRIIPLLIEKEKMEAI